MTTSALAPSRRTSPTLIGTSRKCSAAGSSVRSAHTTGNGEIRDQDQKEGVAEYDQNDLRGAAISYAVGRRWGGHTGEPMQSCATAQGRQASAQGRVRLVEIIKALADAM